EDKFLTGAVDAVIKIYDGVFEELTAKQEYIKKVISLEEDRFHTTLTQGMELLNGYIEDLKKEGKTVLSGDLSFQLYDTFGFPWELTDEILQENSMELDKAAFDAAMKQQRERARAARQDNQRVEIPDLRLLDTEQLTIDETAVSASIACIWKDGELVDALQDGETAGIILDVTPFHAEGGGQVGDTGTFEGEFGKVTVETAKKLPNGTVYHVGYVTEGTVKVGECVKLVIDQVKKLASARNHTATHLLQAALKQVIGEHVNQAGSAVGPDRLRFDFSNFEPVTVEQLAAIETVVNEEVLKATDVEICEMKQDEAKAKGAMALFGEKYGDVVRVVSVPGFSMELCGGAHVKNVGQIGLFKIVSESGVASGVRRIEAVTGKAAIDYMNAKQQILQQAAEKLRVPVEEEIPGRIENLLAESKQLQHQVNEFHAARAKADAKNLLQAVQELNGIQIVVAKADAADMDELRNIADMTCDKLENGVVVLAAAGEDKVSLVVKASAGAVEKGIHAGKIIKEAAKAVGGGGGGRPDMAQAGGRQPENIPAAFDKAQSVIKEQLQ
ncbi:MAG: alanine--tRNA ligase, partial [Selenomonadaceae bacterium]